MDRSVLSGMKEIGTLKARMAKDVESSRLGVGFETLDRQLFKPEMCYDAVAKAGVKWARCQTGWSRCERKKGELDFSWLDEVVENLLVRGVQPWFNVGFGNKLYMPDVPHESAVGCVPIYYPQETQDAWRRFVRELAKRYHGRVKHYEIWNECNIDCFWRPGKSNPEEYAQLVAMSSKEIKAVVPDAVVIACVSKVPNKFILDTLKAGIGEHIDRYALHPYTTLPEVNYENGVANLRRLLEKYAPHVKLWQGECGCPSMTYNHNDLWLDPFNLDETKQAKWLLRRLLTDLSLGFEHVSYFHIADLMENVYVQANGQPRPPVVMGLLNGKSYTPKKAYASLGWLANLFDEGTQPVALLARSYQKHLGRMESKLALSAVRTLTFERKGYPLYAFYLPEETQIEMPVRNGFVLHFMDETEKPIETPVLLDLLQGKVFELPPSVPAERHFDGILAPDDCCRAFIDLPLADYPLVITDKKALE